MKLWTKTSLQTKFHAQKTKNEHRITLFKFFFRPIKIAQICPSFHLIFKVLELCCCNLLQVRTKTTNRFFHAESNRVGFRLDFFGPSEQFPFENSKNFKISRIFLPLCDLTNFFLRHHHFKI